MEAHVGWRLAGPDSVEVAPGETLHVEMNLVRLIDEPLD